jgi:hypothetical protein
MRSRRGGPPTRTKQVDRRPSILIFTEGEKTEDGYLVPWRRQLRDRVLVTIDEFHGAPHPLVERAVQAKADAARTEKRGHGRAYDGIWCMFDRDEHPKFLEALTLAQDHGIGVAVSNPCIELWFVLHFEDQTAHIERQPAQKRANELLGCGKVLTQEATAQLHALYDAARVRAFELDVKHLGDGSPQRSNPSCTIPALVDALTGFPAC